MAKNKQSKSGKGANDKAREGKPQTLAAKLAAKVKPSKKRKKGENPQSKKGSSASEAISSIKGAVTAASVASALTKVDAHWSSALSLPLWLAFVVMSVAAVKDLTSALTRKVKGSPKGSDIGVMAYDVGKKNPAMAFVVYSDHIHLNPKDAAEILKTTQNFYSSREFMDAVVQAFSAKNVTPAYQLSTVYGCLLSLAKGPRGLRRLVREVGMELCKKKAKVPPEIDAFDKEVNSLRKMIKEFHDGHRRKLEILRQAVRDQQRLYDEEAKAYEKVQEFITDYTRTKSGQLNAQILEDVTRRYREDNDLKKKYSLSQYLEIFKQSYGAAQVVSKLENFRSSRGFKKGQKLLKSRDTQRAGTPAPMDTEEKKSTAESTLSESEKAAIEAALKSID